MEQAERRRYLIQYLLAESKRKVAVPADEYGQKRLLRALCNIRLPGATSDEFLRVQDAYLQEEIRHRGVTAVSDLVPVRGDFYLWKGDITTLRCDGIVNAANPQMLGCFCPNHGCIDNAIHSFSGVRLREECAELMRAQGRDEEVGHAKITHAYNLPCRYILHTVGPVVTGVLTQKHKTDLANCYRSCLTLADEYHLAELAFCCISTGEYRFPNEAAAQIALQTVSAYKAQNNSQIKVVFNVFKEEDYAIYARLLGAD